MKKLISCFIGISVLLNTTLLCNATEYSAQDALSLLQEGNATYLELENENISQDKREDTSTNGQHPYAVVITCSDSRVPAELIFHAGIGDLFVTRTAGNVIGDYELGSIEYGTEHLHAPLVVVLGHTGCGAVAAALEGNAHGHIADIVEEISSSLPEDCEADQAEILNVENSISNIRTSKIMQHLEAEETVSIVGAIYDIETGVVSFLDK